MDSRALPAAREGAVVRLGTALLAGVQRLLGVGIAAYARSGAALPTGPSYPVEASIAAMAANPWVWACIQAVSTDLSGLPLVAETGSGVDRVQSSDHWLLQLLERPHPKTGGRKLRKQLVADLKLGNCFVRVWRGPDGRPVQLGRIPPTAIKPIVAADGEEVGWRLEDGTELPWDAVLHVADISLETGPSVVWGASPIVPLSLGLQVDRDSRRQAGRSARRGRIEMLLSPRSDQLVISEDRVQEIVDQYAVATERGDGVYVANTGMEATPLSLTARDMEYSSLADRNRGEVLAVMGVPETRVGSPAANYGTAKEQSRIYWSTLQGLAALLDDELSRLAEPGVRIRHSFAGVDALQIAQTERQARGVIWMHEYGLTAQQAAAYEGFVDLPIPTGTLSSSTAPDPPSASGVSEPRATAAVAGVLRTVAGMYGAGEDPVEVEHAAALLLRQTLRAHGARRLDDVVAQAASVCAASARIRQQDGGDLIELRAFGRDHAERIVRLADLEAA